MMATDVMNRAPEAVRLALQPGPRWSSIEQFRKAGARQLKEQLGPNQVGWLCTKQGKYVMMRADTWHHVYAMAQETNRLQGSLVLIRQAIKLVFTSKKEGERLALEHLSDLVFQFSELAVESPQSHDLVFDDVDESDAEEIEVGNLEFDPAKIERPGKVRR